MRSFRELTEAKETVVFGFGRFNPPTIGHEKLIEKVASVAGSNPFFIYPSHTQGPKDPLPHAKKIAWMRKMFPKYKRNIIADRNAKTAIQIAEKLFKDGYKNLIMVAGSDRLKEFETLLNKYNDAPDKKGNQLFKFDSVKIVSAGERDPDAEGVAGMSASKMRKAASDGKFNDFKTGIPATLNDADKKKLYFEVRKNMGIREDRYMGDMTDFETVRDAYLTGKIWNVGDIVEANGVVGEIVRKGTNYLSLMSEDGKVHKAWLYEINEGVKDLPPHLQKLVKQLDKKEKELEKKGLKVKTFIYNPDTGKPDIELGERSYQEDKEDDDLQKTMRVAMAKMTVAKRIKQVRKQQKSSLDKVKDKDKKTSMKKTQDTQLKDIKNLAKSDLKRLQKEDRNYRQEYDNYQGTPEQIARRSSRNKARRVMGDKTKVGMDVGHADNDPMNNDPTNLRNEDPSENRREPRLRNEVGKSRPRAGGPKSIEKSIKKHIELTNKYIKQGMSKDEASKKAFKDIVKEDVELDEEWWDKVSAKLNQISHPKNYGKMVKSYSELMRQDKYKKRPNMAADKVAREYSGVSVREFIKYINTLVAKKILPQALKAEYQKEEWSFKDFIKQINEKLSDNADQGDYIDDFVNSDAPQFAGKSKKERIAMAIAAFRSKNEEFDAKSRKELNNPIKS
jgi:nicotinamide mononucleotide adenylyltransferase